MRVIKVICLFIFLFILGCTTTQTVQKDTQQKVKPSYSSDTYIGPKKKIAIAEFSNSTPYGQRRLGEGISSILMTELAKADRFILIERKNLEDVADEIKLSMTGLTENAVEELQLIGAEYLLMGDVTKFAVSTEGKSTLVSKKKVQQADVSVDMRMVDVSTGQILLSETGSGTATKETKQVLGQGSSAGYDEALEQDAFRSSVVSLVDKIVKTLDQKDWISNIVKVEDDNIYIDAGRKSNLKINTKFKIYSRSKVIKDNSGKILGYDEEYLGDALLEKFIGEDAAIITTKIDNSTLELPAVVKLNPQKQPSPIN